MIYISIKRIIKIIIFFVCLLRVTMIFLFIFFMLNTSIIVLSLILSTVFTQSIQLFSASTQLRSSNGSPSGSLRGGTTIYIQGVNFPLEPTFIQVYIGTFPCMIPADGVTPTVLSCVTTDSFSTSLVPNLPIKVIFENQIFVVPSVTYTYSDSYTPILSSIYPSASIGGQKLNIYAVNRILNQGDGLRDMGDFLGLYAGGVICSMFDLVQDPIYYDNISRVQCNLANSQQAGRYNFSHHVVIGWASKIYTMRKPSLFNLYYELTILPSIKSMSVYSGFDSGQDLKILGTGFSNYPNKISVKVNGVICDISSSTLNQIDCRLRQKQITDSSLISTNSPITQQNGYIKGSGIFYSRYDISLLSNLTLSAFRDALTSMTNISLIESGQTSVLWSPDTYTGMYGEVFKGYFYAPVSGIYKFRGAADDQFTFLLSSNYGTTTTQYLRQIIFSNISGASADNYYISNYTTTFNNLTLVGGKYYYMEAYHINIEDSGWMKISVQVPNTDSRLGKQSFEVNQFSTIYTNTPEIMQFLLIGAIGGKFNLSLTRINPQTLQISYYKSVMINFNATASQFQTALIQFDSYSASGYGVSCINASAYDINNNLVPLNSLSLFKVVWSVNISKLRPTTYLSQQFQFKGNNLINSSGTISNFSQIRTQNHSATIGGTFTLRVGATPIQIIDMNTRTYTISNIPYNVSGLYLQNAFRQISGFENIEITRTGIPQYGALWIISYNQYFSDVPDLYFSTSMLTGGQLGTTPQINFYQTRKYSTNILFNPIDQTFLFCPSSSPNVIVTVNGIQSVCQSDCSYNFIGNSPKITSQTKNSGGQIVTVGISNPANSNYPTSILIVSIDDQPCTIISGTWQSFTCALPVNVNGLPLIRAGYYDVEVVIQGYGLVIATPGIPKLFYDLVLNTISPSSGATSGGYLISINGSGFPIDFNQANITLCNKTVIVTSITNSLTSIITPTCINGPQNIIYNYNGISKIISFVYNVVSIPGQIISISPTTYSPVKKGIMKIYGSGFGTTSENIVVFLANSTGKIYKMRILSINDTVITCGIPGGLPGYYKVEVTRIDLGDIPVIAQGANNFTYELAITSINPTSGSYYGGTLIKIIGTNFSPDIQSNIVSVGSGSTCKIQNMNQTEISCRMPSMSNFWNSSSQRIVIINQLIAQSTCLFNNCTFNYEIIDLSPNLTQISNTTVISGKGNITLTGNRFYMNYSNVSVLLQNKLSGLISLIYPNSITNTSINFNIPNLQGGAYLVRVRIDPLGQTNSVSLNLQTYLNSTVLKGSLKGGYIWLTGTGLPATWPTKLFTLVITTNGVPIQLQVASTTPQVMKILIPQGSLNYSISLQNPLAQNFTANFLQTSSSTQTLVVLNTLPLQSGNQIIRLNRTLLKTINPNNISIYNVLNQNNLYNITTWTVNSTVLSFNINLSAGQYGFKIWVDTYGWADCGLINVTASVPYTAHNFNVSLLGGKLTVSGNDISSSSFIKVGGFVGKLIQKRANQSIFEIPPLITPQVIAIYPSLVQQVTIIPGKTISDGGSNPYYAFDNSDASYYSSNNTLCYIGMDIGENKLVKVTRIRYFPYYKWTIAAQYIAGAVFEGSIDGVNYSQIGLIDQTIHAGWNSIKIFTNSSYRFIRLKHSNISGCMISELQINGFIYNDLHVSNINDFTITPIFWDGFNQFSFNEAIRYQSAVTPIINSLSTNNGTVYGGTTLAFFGVNFNVGVPTIFIDGIQCNLTNSTLNSTYFQCITGPRLTLPSQNTFSVTFGNNNTLILEKFIYVMRWSDVRTWGTDLPPVQGDLIQIPQGMTLLVDQSTPKLSGIIVMGTIIFSDERPMQINSHFITVNGGKFIAGTQQKPYQNDLTFIMYGQYNDKQQPMFGNKGIGCMNCRFSMYGKPRSTWVQLGSTIQAGTSRFTVSQPVDWKIGDVIVIASTDFDHNQAQRRTITNVSGTLFTVDLPFWYRHFSGVQNYNNDRLQMKAQIGLLTRNIKMMGDQSSKQSEYGSHLMMAGSQGMISQIAFTEFTSCGQPKILGRYCIHFHMNGDVHDSSVVGNAVHDSFARLITIHGVRFLRVANNVGYRIKGHNIFVQDGIQTQNVIQDNLVISSLRTENMLQTDMSVASYWITNPTNYLRRNRAAGGDFYGFWYEIKPNPDGPSATSDVCPIGNPLGESHDNIAHSYKRFGLRIFQLASRTIPCLPIRNDNNSDPWSDNPSIESKFYNYLLYKNGESGVLAQQTGNVIFQNFTIAESLVSGMQFFRTNLTKQLVVVRNTAIIGITRNNAPPTPEILNGSSGIIAPKTSGWSMSNVRFYNFPAPTAVFVTCSQCNVRLSFTNIGAEYFVDRIQFTNISGNYLRMYGVKRQMIYDTDASFSRYFDNITRSSATIVSNFKHLADDPACKSSPTPNIWDNALVCDQSVIIRRVMFTNLQNEKLFDKIAMKVQKISSIYEVVSVNSTDFTQFYSLQLDMQPKSQKARSYSIPYITNRIYNGWWLTGIDFTHVAMDVSKLFTDSDPAVIIKFNYTQNRQLFQIAEFINLQTGPLKNPVATLNPMTCNYGDHVHDTSLKILALCATSRGKSRPYSYLDINAIKCENSCFNSNNTIIKQNTTRLWSNVTQWPSARLPFPHQNVTIPAQWTIVMDINPAPINFFMIDGDIIIPDTNLQVNISANTIWIRMGSLVAGNSTNPYPGKINIQILGDIGDTGHIINQFISGNKLFVVTGRLQLYGIAPSTIWTRTKSIVRSGDSSITLISSLIDWKIGDYIVIGPSFSNTTQHEKVQITNIDLSTNTIRFTPSLNYTHYGDTSVTINNTYGVMDTRSAVGYLTRNIKILSGSNQNWGFHMIVNGYQDNGTLLSGSVILQGVQFVNGGQYDTQNTALKILNTIGTNPIKIIHSSFHDCKSYCLDIKNINNAVIQNNVFFNARLIHVRALQLYNFTFQNNLMIAATRRPTVDIDQLISCYLTYDQIHQRGNSIKQNVCQGSEGHGFGISYFPCQYLNNSPYDNNTASSAIIGFIFTRVRGSTCYASRGLRAFACQIGQITTSPYTNSIIYQNFIMADVGRGVGLRFGNEGDDRTAFFQNSFISAISRPNCIECYGDSAIDCTNNYAIKMLAITINGQSLPRKFGVLYDVICKEQAFDSKAYLQNITFENYNQVYPNLPQCASNVLFISHQAASDLTGSHHLTNVKCNNCSLNAMAYFTPPNRQYLGWFGGCGDILCTGKNNYLIHDHTGDLLGTPSILLANNSIIGDNTQGCAFIPQINGHHCLRQDLAVLEYQNIAPDYRSRVMWPVYLKFDGGNWNSTTNGWREWNWLGRQPINDRLGRFISVIQLYKTFNMTFQSIPPSDMRLQIQRRSVLGDNSQWVIIKLKYPSSNSIQVQNRYGVVPPITLLDSNSQGNLNTSLCGSNKFFYQNSTIHFVVTGDKNCQVRVSLTNSIQVSARLNMSITDFFSVNGANLFIDCLCSVLGITDISRIKVVSIYSGSVAIIAYIDQEQIIIDNSTQANYSELAQQMTDLHQAINDALSNGVLGSALASVGLGSLLELSTQIYYLDPIKPQKQNNQQSPETESEKTNNLTGLAIGAGIGGITIVGAIIGLTVYIIRKKSKIVQIHDQVQQNSSDEQKVVKMDNESITSFQSPLKKQKQRF